MASPNATNPARNIEENQNVRRSESDAFFTIRLRGFASQRVSNAPRCVQQLRLATRSKLRAKAANKDVERAVTDFPVAAPSRFGERAVRNDRSSPAHQQFEQRKFCSRQRRSPMAALQFVSALIERQVLIAQI